MSVPESQRKTAAATSAGSRRSGPNAEPRARVELERRLLAELAAGTLAGAAGFRRTFEAVLAFQARFGARSTRSTRSTRATGRAGLAGSVAQPGPTPVDLFKYRDLTTVAGPLGPGLEFRTSGTSRGSARRGRHRMADPVLYEAAVRRGFAQAVFGQEDLDAAWRTVAPRWNLLVPASAAWWRDRHSSLAHMARTVWQSLHGAVPARLFVIDPAASDAEFARAVQAYRAQSQDAVTLGLGTGFGFLHWIERLAALPVGLASGWALDPRSRLMETGGYKGRGRELPPRELHRQMAEAFGLPAPAVFAEYGMTELSSQAYEVPDRRGAVAAEQPVYFPAESLRIRVVDADGQRLPPGQIGLIEALDPMNLTSAAWLLTGDLGVILPETPEPPDMPAMPEPSARSARSSRSSKSSRSSGSSRSSKSARSPRRIGSAGAPAAVGAFERRRFQVLGRAAQLAARGCGLAEDLRWLAALEKTRPSRRP